MSEVYKAHVHGGFEPRLWYFRGRKGLEVDLVLETPDRVVLAEVKFEATLSGDFVAPLKRLHDVVPRAGVAVPVEARLVYGGDERQRRSWADVIPWRALREVSC